MKKQGGFGLLVGLLVALVVCVVVFGGWTVWNQKYQSTKTINETQFSEDRCSSIEEENSVSCKKPKIEKEEKEKIKVGVDSYDECIDAGYTEFSPIEGPAFCRAPDGVDYYDNYENNTYECSGAPSAGNDFCVTE